MDLSYKQRFIDATVRYIQFSSLLNSGCAYCCCRRPRENVDMFMLLYFLIRIYDYVVFCYLVDEYVLLRPSSKKNIFRFFRKKIFADFSKKSVRKNRKKKIGLCLYQYWRNWHLQPLSKDDISSNYSSNIIFLSFTAHKQDIILRFFNLILPKNPWNNSA